jgi:FtsP/CotA-like multicopper oxidase with cupredoxin domain
MPNQNPWDASGMNAFGRWHYGPWFWPPTKVTNGPVANPYYQPDPTLPNYDPSEQIPGTPNPSMAAEAFMDTPVVNGMAYPYLEVDPKAYRLRILNAADDRFFNLQTYVADPAVVTASGTTGTEVKMVPAVATPGFPEDWPTDGREGGVPDPAMAGPALIQIGTEGGFLPEPVVLNNQPVDWNLDQTNFDFGVVNKGTLILGTAERADVVVDFSKFAGKTVILYNDSPAPFPAIDPRYDYYTGGPDQTDIGGAPTTQPGYGPNTRTIMQFRVGAGADSSAPPNYYNPATLAALESAFAKTATKPGVFEVSQDEIIVPEVRYNSAYNQTFPADPYVRIMDNKKTFKTVSGATVPDFPLEPKAIQDEMGEAYDKEYGRMSAMLGVELPFTVAGAQNFVLFPYLSPPVEIIKGSVYGTPIGSAGDGTQIWKITHNGVDTHTIHFHLFNVQLINRVAWDNAIRPPDPNELGWKETIRVNPLQDTIVALRPVAPTQPFEVPNSVRLIDPTKPEGAILANSTLAEANGQPPVAFDPNGEPIDITNHYVNLGWEYVYHCHILAHEEMDMMHAVAFGVPPAAPTGLTATVKGAKATLTWMDNSVNETSFTVQRRTNGTDWTTIAVLPGTLPGAADTGPVTYTDPTNLKNKVTYYYRVFANNVIGDTWDYSDPNLNEGAGFPNMSIDSDYSNQVIVTRK